MIQAFTLKILLEKFDVLLLPTVKGIAHLFSWRKDVCIMNESCFTIFDIDHVILCHPALP